MMKTFGRIVTIFCFACVVCMVSGNHGGRSDETKVVQRKRRDYDYDYHLLHMMTNLQRQIRAVEKEMKKRHKEVAFTVVHDGTGQRITHQSQVVKYTQVKINIGGGYHKYSGRFVAPVKGTYVFFFSLEPTPGTKASFVITVNDREMVEGVSGAIHNEYNMSSNMVVVSLRKGDHVNVMTHPTWSVDPRQRLKAEHFTKAPVFTCTNFKMMPLVNQV